MIKILYFLTLTLFLNSFLIAMEKKPYHHLSDGTFRNPEGSPVRSKDVNFPTKHLLKKKN